MIERQEKILIDIYERSRQGKDSVVLPGCEYLLIDTQEKQIFINDLRLLQNEGYINGILEHPSDIKEGKAFYLLTNTRITPKGIKFCANLTESVYIGDNGWLLSYNDYTRKDNKIYLACNASQSNSLISIAQIYSKIKSLKRPILSNLIEKREEENFIAYIIKKPLIIMSESEQIWNNNLIFGFRFEKNEYWQDEMLQDLKNKFGYEGKNFRTIFQNEVEISCHFKSQIRFIDCIFKGRLSTMKDVLITFGREVMFVNCKFHSKVSFLGSKFETDMTFYKSKFNAQVNFQGANFQGNAYFSESVFAEKADFTRGEFEKTAGFYGATFEKMPNFSQAIFNGSLNLVNAKLDFDFESTQKTINQSLENPENQGKSLDKVANDFRDSFRLFKNALIKDNNLLEASNHHRIELYCKEIELDSKKPNIFSRGWIDKWVLRFYRHTSDHHTDLLKILNNIMMLIALFGIFSFGMFCFGEKEIIASAQDSQTLWYLFGKIPLSSHFLDYWNCEVFLEFVFIIVVCFVFVAIFFILLWLTQYEWFNMIKALCLMGVVSILAIKPALLLPIFGKLLDESLKVNFPAFTSLSIVYAILMFLLLFSLQKTARKNSIVPS